MARKLQFGSTAPTLQVLDGEPGQEIQVDTSWVGSLTLLSQRRRFRAWIFTAVFSRYRFVYPVFEETTELMKPKSVLQWHEHAFLKW